MPTIPYEISKTISRLRNEAKEKLRIADELQRLYTGEDPNQTTLPSVVGGKFHGGGVGPPIPSATVESLIEYVKVKNRRLPELARDFNVSSEQIKKLVSESKGKLTIPDWRGWVKLGTHK